MPSDRRIRLPIGKGRGTVLVHESDLHTYDCPECKGLGHKTINELDSLRIHSERAWQCTLCAGVGTITCTEKTFLHLKQHFESGGVTYFFVTGPKAKTLH